MSQYEAIRDSRLQEQAYWAKVREDNQDVLREIRRVRQAIADNMEKDSIKAIDQDLEDRLIEKLRELKAIFK